MNHCEKIGNLFKDYRVFIYESDSTDYTPQILQEWQNENPKVFFKSEKLNLERRYDLSDKRFEIMATVRNKYAAFAKEHFSGFDYICVIDQDLRGGTSIDGVLNSFGYAGRWDVITANGIDFIDQYYYDMATFYTESFEEEHFSIEQKPGKIYANIKKGHTRPVFKRGEPLVRVCSAFGGLAFYRNEVFKQSIYSAKLCDHASFHETLWHKGYSRIFVNPSMIVVR